MRMKYFRFLYGETRSCLLHFGELEDTCTGERFTFLYLRGSERHVNQEVSEHTLFLCPKHLDLVVLGRMDASSEQAFRKILEGVEVDTLVLPDKESFPVLECISEVKEVKRLSPDEGEHAGNSCQITAAGWRFSMKCYTEGAVVMMHGLAECGGEKPMFEDCVMNVKVLNSDRQCCEKENPDGYGCALGCTMRMDYDVCNHQRKEGEASYLTGTLLLSGRENSQTWKMLRQDLNDDMEKVRFFGLGGDEECILQEEGILQQPSTGNKKYYIGLENEMTDTAVARICRSGPYQIPVILGEDEGICCSGLLKYANDNQ